MDERTGIFQYLNVIEIIKNKFEMCTNVGNKMSISETAIMEVKRNKLRRKSYAREFKLTVVTWFHENGKNVHQTLQHFNLDRKQLRNWVKAD